MFRATIIWFASLATFPLPISPTRVTVLPMAARMPFTFSKASASMMTQALKGKTTAEVSRSLGVTEHTYYRWRKEYGGMRIDQARRLKELEQENSRLKKVVADFALDNAILKEAVRGNS